MMDLYGLILVLYFSALFGVVIVVLVKILTELQSFNRTNRNLDRRAMGPGATAQHRRES
jgi:hypothetical protein